MILNSPVRKAAAARDFNELESRGFKQEKSANTEKGAVNINLSMDAAIASEMMEDVKIASVMADNGSGPKQRSYKVNKMIDMTDVLSELKVKNNVRKQRPVSVHSDMPSAHASSYSSANKRMQIDDPIRAEKIEIDAFSFGKSSTEASPLKAAPDARESRISRRQARSIAEVDSNSFDYSLTGLASNPVTPRSARSIDTPESKDGALLEMEGTLKEFDDVIRSL